MLSILIANIKGGCGKTTIATNLAAAFAGEGHATALADLDRQRSSFGWTERRPEALAPVVGLDWAKDVGKTPKDVDRLVLDAPAALRTNQLEELVAMADVVVVPLCPGAYDEQATKRFLDRLEALKPIARGRKAVAIVANRVRPTTRAAARLDDWLDEIERPPVTRLRDTQLYVETAAAGTSVFDLSSQRALDYRADWKPLLREIE
jgi:chromosome partitioning protein